LGKGLILALREMEQNKVLGFSIFKREQEGPLKKGWDFGREKAPIS